MKNYFIANGEILNTDMSLEEIESQVQESLNENTSGMAQFRIRKSVKKKSDFSLSGIFVVILINL